MEFVVDGGDVVIGTRKLFRLSNGVMFAIFSGRIASFDAQQRVIHVDRISDAVLTHATTSVLIAFEPKHALLHVVPSPMYESHWVVVAVELTRRMPTRKLGTVPLASVAVVGMTNPLLRMTTIHPHAAQLPDGHPDIWLWE